MFSDLDAYAFVTAHHHALSRQCETIDPTAVLTLKAYQRFLHEATDENYERLRHAVLDYLASRISKLIVIEEGRADIS